MLVNIFGGGGGCDIGGSGKHLLVWLEMISPAMKGLDFILFSKELNLFE